MAKKAKHRRYTQKMLLCTNDMPSIWTTNKHRWKRNNRELQKKKKNKWHELHFVYVLSHVEEFQLKLVHASTHMPQSNGYDALYLVQIRCLHGAHHDMNIWLNIHSWLLSSIAQMPSRIRIFCAFLSLNANILPSTQALWFFFFWFLTRFTIRCLKKNDIHIWSLVDTKYPWARQLKSAWLVRSISISGQVCFQLYYGITPKWSTKTRSAHKNQTCCFIAYLIAQLLWLLKPQ